jgi:hypothetical protein
MIVSGEKAPSATGKTESAATRRLIQQKPPRKEKQTVSVSLCLSVKFSPRLALGFLQVDKSGSERLDGKFSAMEFGLWQSLEKVGNMLRGNGPGIFNRFAFDHVDQCIGACDRINAAYCVKGRRTDPAISRHQEYFQSIAALPAALSIAIGMQYPFLPVVLQRHGKKIHGVLTQEFKSLSVHPFFSELNYYFYPNLQVF